MDYIDSHNRRFIYPSWLKFFSIAAALAAFFLLGGSSSLFSNSDPSLPWNEQASILPPGKTPQFKLSEDHPPLTGNLRYKAQVEQDGQPRGSINVLICQDGTVKGVWNGEYDRADNTHCLIMAASFKGNIDPTREYIENGVQDPSKLYFITAGAYNVLETMPSTGKSRDVSGFVYLRGWLNSNYTVVGELVITRNKKTFETFSWAAFPRN